MTLANETDAREAIRLILDDNATDSDYSNAGSKPNTIEKVESSPQNQKRNRSGDQLYIWIPADTELGKFGADGATTDESVVVQVEAWTTTSDTQAKNLVDDVRNITGGYANDSKGSTAWVDIYPVGELDFRHEKNPRTGDDYVGGVQVGLERIGSV